MNKDDLAREAIRLEEAARLKKAQNAASPDPEYHVNGKLRWVKHYIATNVSQLLHKEDGPARIYYYDDGSLRSEEYFIYDKLHRTDGPAYIFYNLENNVAVEEHWINGKQIISNVFKLNQIIKDYDLRIEVDRGVFILKDVFDNVHMESIYLYDLQERIKECLE